ncbi:MAG: tRNA pseudouridine(38-40) synthase TruA [Actinomycetales bacterium]
MRNRDHRPDDGGIRVRLDLAYDGWPFSGWAVQPALPTVQGALESALALLLRRPVRVTVAGRTDAGVHARGQVVHVDLAAAEWAAQTDRNSDSPETVFRRRLTGALHRILGSRDAGAIAVYAATAAPPGFDARFSALWRRYSYRIGDPSVDRDPLQRYVTYWHKATLDLERMNEAAAPLLGLQDFRAFAKPREGSTTVRELQNFAFSRGPGGFLSVTVQADAFCHNMVRSLVGAALRVGDGREQPGWMRERLDSRVRDAKSVLAPPHPLVLEEVKYPDDGELLARAQLTRARRAHH